MIVYIGAWATAGAIWSGYDPTSQAISELFATGAPPVPRALLVGALVLTGLLLVAFGWMLHVVMPGDEVAGPVAVAVSGIGTLLVPTVPCTPGCPGAAASAVDAWHTILAGGGYLALTLAPLLFARRLWRPAPTLARVSLGFGVAASVGFALYAGGVGGELGGLLQRGFNTTADAWLVVVGVDALRRLANDELGVRR